jgi:hypothetical protein
VRSRILSLFVLRDIVENGAQHIQVSSQVSKTTLTILIHNLHSHIARLGLAVSTGRARKVERAAERKLAARAANIGGLGVVGNDPRKR